MRQVSQADIAEFELVWLNELMTAWIPGYLYQVGQVVRPTRPNGFFLEVTGVGQSGHREPPWPTVEETVVAGSVGGVQVGSVVFAVKAPENASIPTIESVTNAITPSGILVVSEPIQQSSRSTRLSLDGSAASLGTYEILSEIIDSLARDHVKRFEFELVE